MKMKVFFACALLGLTFCTQHAAAQNTAIPEPEFLNQVMFVSPDSTLEGLEKVNVSLYRKPGFGMYVSAKYYHRIDGCCSNVRHSGKPTNRFIVKVEPGIDPASVFELLKFESGEEHRMLLIGSSASIGKAFSSKGQTKITAIQMNVKKITAGVYVMSPQSSLEDGEYAFVQDRQTSTLSILKGYAFSVGKRE